MSLDAGGLAQMTYNNQNGFGASGLGMPTGSFASRGKGSQLKRLSLSPVGENHVDANPTPRTSRGHLLAGLRTAPKGQNGAIPASAPYNQTQHRNMPNNQFAQQNAGFGGLPQTAIGNSFGLNSPQQYGVQEQPQQHQPQQYSLGQQVLAPPSLQFDHEDEQMDPTVLAQLLQTEQYLAQRQRMLQQQLLTLTTGQFQGMNMNGNGFGMHQQYPQTPMSPQYGRQMNGMGMNNQGPIIQEVPNQPGVLMIYQPQTGEVSYMMDPNFQNQQRTQLANSPPPPTPSYTNSPPRGPTPGLMPENSTPSNDRWGNSRSVSPPKKTSSPPQDVEPLPPPSANAFRRGHKFQKSIATEATPLKSGARLPGAPTTPVTGTFGPGQNRAGEHPVRQPRGPPSIEELVAKPTSKHEGSKNFATRQRRRAVHNLVRAGKERRGGRSGSGGSMSPVSETDGFNMASDNDTESVRSGSVSRKTSIGSLRAQASGAIGSERRAKKEGSVDSLSSHGSHGKMEIRIEEPPKTSTPGSDRVKTPMLVLTSAEKRKTWVS
jgi:hypothetical protein